jgi:hypothetical protein
MKIMESAIGFICGIAPLVLIAVVVWLWLASEPDQYSAECEYLREEMQQKGVSD